MLSIYTHRLDQLQPNEDRRDVQLNTTYLSSCAQITSQGTRVCSRRIQESTHVMLAYTLDTGDCNNTCQVSDLRAMSFYTSKSICSISSLRRHQGKGSQRTVLHAKYKNQK